MNLICFRNSYVEKVNGSTDFLSILICFDTGRASWIQSQNIIANSVKILSRVCYSLHTNYWECFKCILFLKISAGSKYHVKHQAGVHSSLPQGSWFEGEAWSNREQFPNLHKYTYRNLFESGAFWSVDAEHRHVILYAYDAELATHNISIKVELNRWFKWACNLSHLILLVWLVVSPVQKDDNYWVNIQMSKLSM